jgi:hypothetical protein
MKIISTLLTLSGHVIYDSRQDRSNVAFVAGQGAWALPLLSTVLLLL